MSQESRSWGSPKSKSRSFALLRTTKKVLGRTEGCHPERSEGSRFRSAIPNNCRVKTEILPAEKHAVRMTNKGNPARSGRQPNAKSRSFPSGDAPSASLGCCAIAIALLRTTKNRGTGLRATADCHPEAVSVAGDATRSLRWFGTTEGCHLERSDRAASRA